MKLAVLYSGGKDSNYALYLAKKHGHEIVCLITMIAENKESYMFQTQAVENTSHQARALGIPLIKQKTAGEKEEELEDLKKAIKKAINDYRAEGVVTGAVESIYQASRVQRIANELRIECFNPLWQKKAKDYWEEMLKEEFKIIIVGVSAEGLEKKWLGKTIGKKELEELEGLSKKHKFHLGFEGGEAETFVLWQPMFKKELRIKNKKN
jgi:diphthine-ammonia ligase